MGYDFWIQVGLTFLLAWLAMVAARSWVRNLLFICAIAVAVYVVVSVISDWARPPSQRSAPPVMSAPVVKPEEIRESAKEGAREALREQYRSTPPPLKTETAKIDPAKVAVFERHPIEWDEPNAGLLRITPGMRLRAPYRTDRKYRVTVQVGHWNPGVVFNPGADLFLTFYGPFEMSRVEGSEPDLGLWRIADSRTNRWQWWAKLPGEIRPSAPSTARGPYRVTGVNQSLFIKAPVPVGEYRVEYLFDASTADTRQAVSIDGHFFLEIYCPPVTKCL
jgi:hypothetical protein